MATGAASLPRVLGGGMRVVRACEEEVKKSEKASEVTPEVTRARKSGGSIEDP